MKNKSQESKRQFLQTQQGLDNAKFNLSGKRYNVACFLAQQSAEKALKAFLFLKGAEEVWGHSTAELCKDVQSFDKDFKSIENESASLDKYYIPTRYPNALPGAIPSEAFNKEDANTAISLAEKILNFIKSKAKGQL